MIKNFLFLIFVMLIIVDNANAFKPNISQQGDNSHQGITENILRNISIKLDGGDSLSFSGEAISEISSANVAIDNVRLGGGYWVPEYHCDNELIDSCTTIIKTKVNSVISAIKSKSEYKSARKVLGESFHTVQDFYAHSNWINISNKKSVEPYKVNFDGVAIANLGYVSIENPDRTTGSTILPDRFFGTTTFESAQSVTCTWQSHIEGRYNNNDKIIKSTDATLFVYLVPTNIYREYGKENLTSGYFIQNGTADPPLFKCDHGLGVNSKTRGIGKDKPTQPGFNSAINVAKKTTKYIIERILNSDGIQGNEEAIRGFLDQPKAQSGSLGFIVDTTGSMGSTIRGIKNAISTIVTDIENDPDTDVTDFLVMSFGDPNLGNVFKATSPSAMQSLVDDITLGVPDGGGDAPERAFAALKRAIDAASEGSILYLYTDASTKEPELASSIVSEASQKNIQINFFVSNPSLKAFYETVTKPSGGETIFYEHTVTGAQNTVNSIKTVFSGDAHEALVISDTVSGERAVSSNTRSIPGRLNIVEYTSFDGNSATHFMPVDPELKREALVFKATPKEYPVNVDGSVSNMAISISMAPLGEIKLFRPNGTEALDLDIDVEITKSSVNQFITVKSPIVGEWKLTVTGDDGVKYDVNVKMNSNIRFVDFSFAEEKGRPGHTGLFPIDGQPMVGDTQFVIGTFTGEINTVVLELISLKGEVLKTIELTELSNTEDSIRYFGTIDLPIESFRVRAKGTDKDGNAFERVNPIVYTGQSVSVSRSPAQNDMVPSRIFSARFIVKNTGLTDTFALSATDTSGYFQSINIPEVTLVTDGTQEIEVILDVPIDALDGDTDTVTLTATSTANPDSTNSASNTFTVNGDSDGEGIPDIVEKGPSGDYDGNNDLIPDYQQSKVASFYALGTNVLVTLEVLDGGELSEVKGQNSPSSTDEPENFQFLLNHFDFKIIGLANGEETRVKIHVNGNLRATKYYKYGSTSTITTDHWYEYTRAVFDNGEVILTLKDGAHGDDDLTENGVIVDPGGLGFPVILDADGDGITDAFEDANGLDKNNPADAAQDPDGDGLTNLEEFQNNTNPHNRDTDGDGFTDGVEVAAGTDPNDAASHPTVIQVTEPIPTISEWAIILLTSMMLIMGGLFYRQRQRF